MVGSVSVVGWLGMLLWLVGTMRRGEWVGSETATLMCADWYQHVNGSQGLAHTCCLLGTVMVLGKDASGIAPAAAAPRRIVDRVGHADWGRHSGGAGWVVISAHRNPASSRAIAATTTLRAGLRASRVRKRRHSRC